MVSVAAYNADIQVVVKGVNKVTALTNEIKAADSAVKKLNKAIIGKGGKGGTEYENQLDKVGKKARFATLNINNLQKAVSKASSVLNKSTFGTPQATKAANAYVAANQALNDQLRQRIALLKQTSLIRR